MDTAQLAVIIVGMTEFFKNTFEVKNKLLKMLVTVLVGAVVITLYNWQGDNAKLFVGLTAFSTATLSYDIIVRRLTGDSGSSNSSTTDSSHNTDSDVQKQMQ